MSKYDPDLMVARMLAESDNIVGMPNAGLLQGMILISAAGFSIAAAIREVACAVRSGAK